MSKSLKRVEAALADAGIEAEILEVGQARTAAEAAEAAGCHLDQIAKSIIFQVEGTGECVLFLTAGGNQVDGAKAAVVADAALTRADANAVRKQTGFAIGGVSPLGHLSPIRAFWDPRLSEFDVIWAAAGTPRHIFPIDPGDLQRLTGAAPAEFTA